MRSSLSQTLCGFDHTEIGEEGDRNLVAEFHSEKPGLFVSYYESKFKNRLQVKRVVTYRQFWQGQHVPKLWDLPQFHHHHLHY